METFTALVRNGTAENLLIFNLFQLLLTGVTLFILLYQMRPANEAPGEVSDRLLAVAFAIIGIRFALLTVYCGARFFSAATLAPLTLERLTHALLACALTVVAAAFRSSKSPKRTVTEWVVLSCAAFLSLAVVDAMSEARPLAGSAHPHSAAMLLLDMGGLIAVALSMMAVARRESGIRRSYVAALGLFGIALILHFIAPLLPARDELIFELAEEGTFSVALFGFAWLMGERSPKLLDRIFVRLNLTFILLAMLIMMVTAGMDKYQYMKLAEQRATPLADFLQHELNRYGGRGEDLEHILLHATVTDRVVAEFGNIPELRKVNVYLDGQRATFGYTQAWSVKQEIVRAADISAIAEPANGFSMLLVPVNLGPDKRNRIELLGTMDYINRYIGKYIILIYSVFTVVVVLAMGIIGIIVAEGDRLLQRKYAELEETHRRLAQAAKLASIGELAGGMAHEINTPITSILSLATHLAEDHGTAGLAPRQRSSLQLIARQAERVSRIVGGLLNFSRQSQLHVTQIEVAEVVETAITLMQYRLDDAGIQLQRAIDPALTVRADAGALTEVVLNLLTNAIDAMPHGGTVRARAHRTDDGGIRLEVADTGTGILPEELPRIFDPFYTTKEPGRGTGLGLSVSHGLVKRHGGEIWAESEPGVGTTLIVTLPAEAKYEAAHPGR